MTFYRLWIPSFLVWCLLFLLSPFVVICALIGRVSVLEALSTMAQIAGAVRGTLIEARDRRYSVLIRIS